MHIFLSETQAVDPDPFRIAGRTQNLTLHPKIVHTNI